VPLNGIIIYGIKLVNGIKHTQIEKVPLTTYFVWEVYLVIVVIQLMESVIVWLKVMPLSGVHCKWFNQIWSYEAVLYYSNLIMMVHICHEHTIVIILNTLLMFCFKCVAIKLWYYKMKWAKYYIHVHHN
jgi:hypothetical protein